MRIQSVHLFCCSQSLISGVHCDIENCLMQLYVGPLSHGKCRDSCCHGVPIENPVECEVQGIVSFLQADKILVYLAEEESSRVELFCCTTMHVRILPGRQKPCCMRNSIGTSSSTWNRQTFSCFKNGSPGDKRFQNDAG